MLDLTKLLSGVIRQKNWQKRGSSSCCVEIPNSPFTRRDFRAADLLLHTHVRVLYDCISDPPKVFNVDPDLEISINEDPDPGFHTKS
jgi:hypothetical protein